MFVVGLLDFHGAQERMSRNNEMPKSAPFYLNGWRAYTLHSQLLEDCPTPYFAEQADQTRQILAQVCVFWIVSCNNLIDEWMDQGLSICFDVLTRAGLHSFLQCTRVYAIFTRFRQNLNFRLPLIFELISITGAHVHGAACELELRQKHLFKSNLQSERNDIGCAGGCHIVQGCRLFTGRG